MQDLQGLNIVVFSDDPTHAGFVWVHARERYINHIASICVSGESGNLCVVQTYPFMDWDWLGMQDVSGFEDYLKGLAAINQIAKAIVAIKPIGLDAVLFLVDELIVARYPEIELLDAQNVTPSEWHDIYTQLESHQE